jgi:hypothetical protein
VVAATAELADELAETLCTAHANCTDNDDSDERLGSAYPAD